MDSLKNKVAIVGAADTEVGIVPHLSATQLYVKAAKLALDDAGLTKNDIDGLITCVSFAEPIMYHAEMIAEYMQIFPRYCMTAPSRRRHHSRDNASCGVRDRDRLVPYRPDHDGR